VVTSYPLLRRDIDLYRNIKFQYCFLDEAQHIKNPNTLNARTAKQINSEMNFALTGTPIETPSQSFGRFLILSCRDIFYLTASL